MGPSGRKPLRLAIASVIVLSLAGCADKWERPPLGVDAPGQWRDDSGARPHWPDAAWWRGFKSTELSLLIEAAQRDNQDIGAAKARIEQADAQVRITGASLIPLISASADAGVQRNSTSNGGGGGAGRSGRARGRFQIGANASYELDFWGKNRAEVRSAQASADSARFAADVIAISTVTSVANTYFALLASQEQLAIARGNVRSARVILDSIEERIKAGTATALDRARQRTVVDDETARIPELEEDIRLSENALALLLGRPPIRSSIKGGRLAALAAPTVSPGIPSEVLLRRPDVRQAEADLRASDQDITAARAAFLPSFSLTAQGGFESVALKTLFASQSFAYALAAGVAQPILDPRLPGNLDLAKGRYREDLFVYRKAAVQAFVDVENGLISVRKTAAQERLRISAVKSAQQAYDIAREQLKAGAVDISSVLLTQQALFEAQDALVSVRLARYQAIVSLFAALGGGWGPADVEMAGPVTK